MRADNHAADNQHAAIIGKIAAIEGFPLKVVDDFRHRITFMVHRTKHSHWILPYFAFKRFHSSSHRRSTPHLPAPSASWRRTFSFQLLHALIEIMKLDCAGVLLKKAGNRLGFGGCDVAVGHGLQ